MEGEEWMAVGGSRPRDSLTSRRAPGLPPSPASVPEQVLHFCKASSSLPLSAGLLRRAKVLICFSALQIAPWKRLGRQGWPCRSRGQGMTEKGRQVSIPLSGPGFSESTTAGRPFW